MYDLKPGDIVGTLKLIKIIADQGKMVYFQVHCSECDNTYAMAKSSIQGMIREGRMCKKCFALK